MKTGKYSRLALIAGATLSLLAGAAGGAVAQEPADQSEVMTTTRAQEVRTTLEERLTRRKEALTERLTTAQTTRLRGRCQAAQVKLAAVSIRANTITTDRLTVYQDIQVKLNALATKLESEVSTADLEAALVTLAENITAFETATANYKQTLADLGDLDCVADPTAFKASLEVAKTEQATLAQAGTDIRTYVTETVKPALQAIRTSLQDREDN